MSNRGIDVDGYTATPDKKSRRRPDSRCCNPFWSKFYRTPIDLIFTIGWSGIIFVVWTLSRAVMHTLQLCKYAEGGFPLTTMMSFSFSMSEGGVILLLGSFVAILSNSSSNDFYDLRSKSISFSDLRKLLRARANIASDMTLFFRAFLWLLVEIALIVVLTWDPRNYDGNLYASQGVVKNTPVVMIFYLFVLIKDLVLLSGAYDRNVTVQTRSIVMKVDAATDRANDEDAEVPENERALLGEEAMQVL